MLHTMHFNFYPIRRLYAVALFLLMILISCGEKNSVFVAEVKNVDDSGETIEIEVEQVETDNVYSMLFAVYDSLLISCRPNSNDYIFYVANLKTDELIGSFMHRGKGPTEYLGLNQIKRIERKGDDLVALTYEPVRHELIEWNITKSIEIGRDSVICLGIYKNSNDIGLTYADIYRIGMSKYLGYTHEFFDDGIYLLPKFSIFDGCETEPDYSITFVNDNISYRDRKASHHSFFSSVWSLRPDNTKIVNAMTWLEQINIIDLDANEVASFRIAGSPDEKLFKTTMENVTYQYHDVVCDDNSIYALYFGDIQKNFDNIRGCYRIHEYDWNGNLKKKYRLPIPILRLWFDSSSDTLYGYSEPEDAIYKIKVDQF